ncbi:hypothetical protein [Candidatus Entotheonella palauensis]|uniref:Uncharacterized protein n=1 Tax=Candidatus Entotheonella gemina TaxID=1429439 RepID=W4M6L4_9BACT|nr:hypothetical protein [Candidatus Entotheonella palauensis]ETX05581.1 MAG: hypothetical protein ETSY2_22110 [Candidatus Entotheonella gemina]
MQTLSNVDPALGFLRGEDNPFDTFVAGQEADDDFFNFHVPELHQPVMETLCLAMERYRRPDYRIRQDLRQSRAVIIRGARGAGKTHLLHALQRRDGARELLVRPRYFDKQYGFAEYLLKELVAAIVTPDDTAPAVLQNPLDWMAEALTRRMLVEVLRSLSPQQWLYWTGVPHSLGIVLGFKWRRACGWRHDLILQLSGSTELSSLPELCLQYGLSPERARDLLTEFIEQRDTGSNARIRMRRQLLRCLADVALHHNREPLADFLEDGFAKLHGGLAPSRTELVDDLLRALIEIITAAGVAIVYAFDNLERLFKPVGQFDLQTAQSFFAGLAQMIDGIPGMLFMIYAETGMWEDCTREAIDSFAEARLLQGVRLRDHGIVNVMELESPSPEQLTILVQRRMQPLLQHVPEGDELDLIFPFQSEDIHHIAASPDVLRTMLRRLLVRYDEIVLGTASPHDFSAPEPSPPKVEKTQAQVEREVLAPQWEFSLQEAKHRLDHSPRSALASELHGSMRQWLQMFAGRQDALIGWQLKQVESARIGHHPTYGEITVCHWSVAEGQDLHRVGIGTILAQGPGLQRDLQVKLEMFNEQPRQADELIMLWPDRAPEFSVDNLPAGTRKIWEDYHHGHPARNIGVSTDALIWLLGFGQWLGIVLERQSAEWPSDAVAHFVHAQTASFLSQLLPSYHETGS